MGSLKKISANLVQPFGQIKMDLNLNILCSLNSYNLIVFLSFMIWFVFEQGVHDIYLKHPVHGMYLRHLVHNIYMKHPVHDMYLRHPVHDIYVKHTVHVTSYQVQLQNKVRDLRNYLDICLFRTYLILNKKFIMIVYHMFYPVTSFKSGSTQGWHDESMSLLTSSLW